MKNLAKFTMMGSLAILCFSCGGSSSDSTTAAKDSNNAKMDSTTTATPTIPPSVSKGDQDFAVNTANAGMTEIQAGQMAEQKGMAKDVKEYGAMMVKDHTAAADKLKMIAASKNLTLPSTLSSD